MILNIGILKNPFNWVTVGLMAAFFIIALREILRLFESGQDTADAVTSVQK